MVLVKKASGELQEFDEKKLRTSLTRVGATVEMIDEILGFIKPQLFDGIPTKKIYAMAIKKLRKLDVPASCMYKLKWAIMRIGQQGYPFEHYVGKLLEKMGYEIKLNQTIKGQCIEHEVDVSAKKGDDKLFIECKHRSKPGIVLDVQTALYVYARFLDLKNVFNRGMLLTNSKLSQQAIDYANCVGLDIKAWKYPPGKSLEKEIERLKVFPITVLHKITGETLSRCFEKNIVTISELVAYKPEELAQLVNIPVAKANESIKEARKVLERGI